MFEETVSRFSSLAAQLPSFEKVEYNGGRIEKRTCTVLNQLFFVDSAAKFKDCQSIIRIIAERTLKNQPEKNYSGSSLLPHQSRYKSTKRFDNLPKPLGY
ncbi:MAG: hypothetical protein IPG29_09890 [Sphingobacteriales bacterium]|nr:hypothetical protein [Sphingobacteriales bacterium]